MDNTLLNCNNAETTTFKYKETSLTVYWETRRKLEVHNNSEIERTYSQGHLTTIELRGKTNIVIDYYNKTVRVVAQRGSMIKVDTLTGADFHIDRRIEETKYDRMRRMDSPTPERGVTLGDVVNTWGEVFERFDRMPKEESFGERMMRRKIEGTAMTRQRLEDEERFQLEMSKLKKQELKEAEQNDLMPISEYYRLSRLAIVSGTLITVAYIIFS